MQSLHIDLFEFMVVKGHQVASGKANDPRFPNGTIKAQAPYFKALGLNISAFYPATLNANFDCKSLVLKHFDYYFKQVKWHKELPAEDFKFCHCTIIKAQISYAALIYQPQVGTKIEHIQPPNQLEILAPYIDNIHYGDSLNLSISKQAIILSSEV